MPRGPVHGEDARRLGLISAVLAAIGRNDVVPKVRLTDLPGSQAASARFGKPPRLWISRDTVDAGADALRGEVAHEYAHLIDPHDRRDRLRILIALGAIALWLGALAVMTYPPRIASDSAPAWPILAVTFAGWPIVAGVLWYVARIHHRTELRADRTAAELLGDSRPVLVMLDRVAARHIKRSRSYRMSSRLTHPEPERRCQALLGAVDARSALAQTCDSTN